MSPIAARKLAATITLTPRARSTRTISADPAPNWGHARRELDYRTNTVTLTGRRLVLPLPGQNAAKTGREVLDADTFDILWESGHALAGFETAACTALYPHA